ncbi:hypothetical protein M409DRAFT_29391 [Zasmidium cellare ATCC 36951]|uniref:Cytochrome P450 n=1 Tax=Zasmidium cellare ATCC 36951 TaxID=1080233 RepID=A0A6A6BZP2_ZASCE|nr:uncharacterized protein M409DRAFT_29391 [Zasmidium cellare ATCC 36951]KAF2160093.1 hypothetical protein M409DRAFT_29391 [Zasmidium cellare ATCC 36951]
MLNPGLASIVLATASISALIYIAYLYAINRTRLAVHLKRKGYHRCPHYQHKDFLFGSDWRDSLVVASIAGTRQQWYREQFATYGKTFETRIWGKRIFQTCDPANVQAELTAPATDVGAGPSRAGLLSWLGRGAFTMDGEFWRRSREMLKPVFKRTAISDMSRLERHLARLFDELEREGLEVDLQSHFIRMFLDFTMDLLIGEDVNTINKEASKIDVASFLTACDESQLQVVRSAQPWIVRWWKGWTKTWNQPLDATQGFIGRYVDSAVQDFETKEGGPIKRSDAFIDELIREAGSKDKTYLRDQILNVFMPGRDSVAIEITHVMLYLSQNPTVYEKVRAEVLAAGFRDDREISYDSLKTLPYVNAVVNEALRLGGPPNGQTVRDILSDIVLPRGGGAHGDQPILIPKGSVLYTQIRSM